MKFALDTLEEHLLIGSTLVEGSTLTEDESRAVLSGRTVAGHPVHEIRELVNYRFSVEWLLGQLGESPYLSADLLTGMHARLFANQAVPGGAYKVRDNFTYRLDGTRLAYRRAAEVPEAVEGWLVDFNRDAVEPVATRASRLYYELQMIHPFEDGNGRLGRVAIAYWLHWKHRRFFRFYAADRLEHLQALDAANAGDLLPLQRFFAIRIADETAA